jgi:elongation factor G
MSAADPTLGVTVGPVNEIILWGQNEPQMDSVVDHLRRGKGLDFQCRRAPGAILRDHHQDSCVGLHPQESDRQHRRVCQGQDRVQPGEPGSGFVFENAVRGAAIPDAFIPAVEKGLRTAKEAGSIAGFPVIDLKCTLIDGGYHEVDSTERTFEIAVRLFPRGDAEPPPAPDRADDEGRGRGVAKAYGRRHR